MNDTLQEYAREQIKAGLAKCTEGQRETFMRIYAGGRKDVRVEAVVEAMPASKLDWALTQVQRTLENNDAKSKRYPYSEDDR